MKPTSALLRLALAWLGLIWLPLSAQTQSIQTIYSFTNGPACSHADLVRGPDGNFYGTTVSGGLSDFGTVFRVTTNGAMSVLASFTGQNGRVPFAGLAVGQDGDFYGTTTNGGNYGKGAVFKMSSAGVLSTLVSFANTNGANPEAALTMGPDGNFYGTTYAGGSSGYGTVFQVTTNGTLTTLVSFANTNGANPAAGLTLGPNGNFYGTTYGGGIGGYGTVFKVTSLGALTTLFYFGGTNGAYPACSLTIDADGNIYGTTSSGGWGSPAGFGSGTVFKLTSGGALTTLARFASAQAKSGLTLGPDDKLYGTTYFGGSNAAGAVFQVTTNGTLTMLYSFDHLTASTNATGANPAAGLTLGADGYLYGTTYNGGAYAAGTVFRIATDGTFGTLASFTHARNGMSPESALTVGPDGNLYGTTYGGGLNGAGTVFSVTPAGTLTTLFHCSQSTGSNPESAPVLGPDGNFYGVTHYGGSTGNGTIYQLTTNGQFTLVHSFSNNVDGATPEGPLLLGPDGDLYGTTYQGGSASYGTVFKTTTNGIFTTLASFTNINLNGAYPEAELTLGPDGNLYGTTSEGVLQPWQSGYGTVFTLPPDGTIRTIFSCDPLAQSGSGFTNRAGVTLSSLTLGPDGSLYGTAYQGGRFAAGTAFKVTTNGTWTTLADFAWTNGAYPAGGLTLGPDGNFYGATRSGGLGEGTVFKLTPGGNLSVVANIIDTNQASAVFGLKQGGLALAPDGNFYGAVVRGGSGGQGFIYRLNLPPTILAGPGNQSVIKGGTASFSCEVFGTAPFSYQWLFNNAPLAGETNSAVTLLNVTSADAGNFQVVVTNAWGSMTSAVAVLALALPPAITGQPASQTLPIGATASFDVSTTGTSPLAYQWYFNDAAISGATNAELSFGPLFTNQDGNYQAIVTNAWGTATSSIANLAVLLQPNAYAILRSPDGAVTLYLASIPGSTNRLWTTTNLDSPFTQWQVISTNIATDGFYQWADTNAVGAPARFYRLSSP